jgi:3-deoxy-D-manno-octulosonic-acid transferase
VIYGLWTAAFAAALALYAPAAVARRLVRGVPLRLLPRLGFDGGAPRVAGPCGWVHAVSVGEALTAAPLLEGLARLRPDLPLVVSTVTETGARIVRERFAGVATHRYFPLDFPGAVRRVLRALDPAFFVCMETELWPNTLRALHRRGVPVMIANGRLSDRSFRRYRLVRGPMRDVLAHVTVFAMRSDEDARRVIALGADPERVVVTGNLKHDAAPDPPGAAELWRRLLGLAPGRAVWVAGSTHAGEEEAVLEAHRRALGARPDLALVLAPRHPERVAEVAALSESRGWRSVLRSALPGGATPAEAGAGAAPVGGGDAPAVILLDTVGELAQLYAVADVVFVGGSLVPLGGHNMLEPAARRKPVLFGPHTGNFREPASLLVEAGAAAVVADAAALGAELARLLADPALAARRGEAGARAVASRHGAARATLELIERFLLRPTGAAGVGTGR